jgi:hypothetical protein
MFWVRFLVRIELQDRQQRLVEPSARHRLTDWLTDWLIDLLTNLLIAILYRTSITARQPEVSSTARGNRRCTDCAGRLGMQQESRGLNQGAQSQLIEAVGCWLSDRNSSGQSGLSLEPFNS